MIQLKNVCKDYKRNFWEHSTRVLNNLSFKIPEGKITGFLGANGSGKTTSIKLMMNFITPTSGEISYEKELYSKGDIFYEIGLLPERPYYYPYLTGREYLDYLGQLQDLKKKMIRERSLFWAQKLSLDHALEQKIHTYSKGMLQRLGFICSLLHGPKLVILDEPLSGLDPRGRHEFKQIIKDVHDVEGTTIFFSSHILSDVQEICSDLVVIDKGSLYYQGPLEGLMASEQGKSLEEIIYGARSK